MTRNKKLVLIIMDGWGKGPKNDSNAIYKANTPFIDSLYQNYPNAELLTSGEDVGLPEGQMGNSEVGHLNIGAGRVVYQDLVKINLAIRDKSFHKQEAILSAINHAKETGGKLHLIGLLSDGGVHSHIDHLKALCDICKSEKFSDVFIHAFTDGRDTDPKSGLAYLTDLQKHLDQSAGKLSSVVGRYYAMDRDKRWERVKLAYDMMVHGTGKHTTDILQAVKESYSENITDEFILPTVLTDSSGNPIATIKDGDAVICFNFRTDRCREITMALTQQDFHEQNMHKLDLHYVTMTNYDDKFRNVKIVYDKDNLNNTLGEVISAAGKKQIRIAETEKYPHVTFFFSGGREDVFSNERRILIPSPKVPTYDLQPEMSAPEVCQAICSELEKAETDFFCLNFANADMVGHTGVFDAVIKAVETVDDCTRKVVETGLPKGYSFLITADHGNADYMINPDGSPNTAHTKFPVPLFLIDNEFKHISSGRLADLAPTILHILGIKQPKEMTGKILV
ncbi:MAG: 2,3-bisphosphoglycerate-independent phosphoglycerate mutase [Bacteroidetes bacterium]|nr:MAG: 2,3-bisphosphoglycerate-independent phosphoglycerate mutase [Bacteroidota bacterium]REK04974.1 MAG: 2,3-bisphosphoglycerate-independent phosphoglycerate mutase [Bacteroidota bacterium]REK36522.1 MAG: 2,3-bisphosphoglycerate-independent phosphoglycerate mutase [Bacteroidota bacterium]REK50888.1 MAG: 2,3-bisphosphoglycerate-independent phosphoglycerate mutase [Bacteroidota bacterium]